MSKPEAAGTQNLEEILASIRKSLSEESTDGMADLRQASAPAARPAQVTAPAAARGPAPAAEAPLRNDGLTNRLAGALNGSGTVDDDDLADFFAHVPKKTSSALPGDAAKPADAANGKDPLWFLGRDAPDSEDPKNATASARTEFDERQQPPTGKVELSRPETLRPSFPPLFGGGRDAAAALVRPLIEGAVDSSNAIGSAVPAAKAEPVAKAVDVADKAKPQTPQAGPAVAPETVVKPAAPEQATAAIAPVAAPDKAVKPAAGAMPQHAKIPVASVAKAPAAPAATPVATPALAAAAPDKADAAGTAQNRALEEMIAQLLEPVLVRWLDDNLPRMIEKTVREEVARAVKAERGVPKV